MKFEFFNNHIKNMKMLFSISIFNHVGQGSLYGAFSYQLPHADIFIE